MAEQTIQLQIEGMTCEGCSQGITKFGGYALVATGFLACPCRLVFTLPLALALLGGTAVGSFLAENTGLIAGLLVVYFIWALWLGFALISAKGRTTAAECATYLPATGSGEKPATAADLTATAPGCRVLRPTTGDRGAWRSPITGEGM